jgi:hypothetical protein
MARYLLVSSNQELDSFSKLVCGKWPDDMVLVALTSAGIVACEQGRKSYTTLDQYSPRAEIISLGCNNYFALATFCERWDIAAHSYTPSLEARGIKPFRFGYYDLKILIDSISVKLLMLKNFIRHAAGCEIFYLSEQDNDIVAGDFLRPRGDVNMYSVLLESFLSDKARLSPLPSPPIYRRTYFRSALRSWVTFARSQLRFIRDSIRALQLFRRNRACHRYLCFNAGHDIQYIVPPLLRLQFQAIPIPTASVSINPEAIDDCASLWQRFLADEDFRDFFSHGDTNYFSFVEEPLAEYIQSLLPRALSDYDYMREFFSLLDIRFSLTGTINLGLVNRCRMLAAQANGVPLITYQEGAGYGSVITPIYDFTEILDGDAMLCYGSGNIEYYEDLGSGAKPLIPVGSAHQDAVRKGLLLDTPPIRISTVMYMGTVVEDNVMHCPNNGLTSTFYCATQVKIFHLLASLPKDKRVIVKPNPSDYISRDLLQLDEFKHIHLETRRFEKVMQGVDLFILDFPSTVLLSCIATTAYVFVLAEEGVTGFTRKQKERLEKRVYLFDDFNSLASAVREIVVSTDGFPPRLDESYMMAYSLHRSDGNVAEYAAKVLAGFSTGDYLD